LSKLKVQHLDQPEEPPDQLVSDPQVCRELGITPMSLWRWSHDAALDFPAKIQIRNRNFRSRRALEGFKARMLRQALAERSAPRKQPLIELATSAEQDLLERGRQLGREKRKERLAKRDQSGGD
jgi:hypothetical protein